MAALLACLAAPAHAGPISKFDNNRPHSVFTSSAPLPDIERCLIDLDGWPLPVAYRQPDRPGFVTIMWSVSDKALGRVDLRAIDGGTSVTSWIKSDQMPRCAPVKPATQP